MVTDPFLIPSIENLGDLPVLDQETLDQLIEIDCGELGLTIEMVELFTTDQPKRFVALKSAIESNDLTKIMEISHAIKGSAGTIGAMRLRALAAMLEAYGRGYEVEVPPSQLYEQLLSAYSCVSHALDAHIKRSTSTTIEE
ncbi:MAG: Hpt domain-containing protein [Holophagaceae bacterium]|nr:Hpt domain-containing protein [Holophagaceae bacterium]